MRIIGGRNRGLALTALGRGDMDAHLRPTTDRVRESIFNLLINGGYDDPVQSARVLDLFAGTGALGLEALSRGALHTTFIDDGAKAAALIKGNIKLCNAHEQTRFIRQNTMRLPPNQGEKYDLIFVDPPYGKNMGEKALASAFENGWLADEALIVWEENRKQIPPGGFKMFDARRYGDTWVHLLGLAQKY